MVEAERLELDIELFELLTVFPSLVFWGRSKKWLIAFAHPYGQVVDFITTMRNSFLTLVQSVSSWVVGKLPLQGETRSL